MPIDLVAVASLALALALAPNQDDEPKPKPDTSLASAPIEAPEAVEGGKTIGGLYRSGPIYLAAQPDPETLSRLAKDGVTVVINLRPPEEIESVPFDEPALVKSLGVDYVTIPIGRGPYAPRLEAVEQLRETLAAHEGKALIHCSAAIRASRLWAAHLVKDRGLSREQVDAFTQITTGGPARVEQFLGDEPENP
ncbi:beta-lactamase hydrolase domain-containing protein [Tautonia marina]|uniref:beta-lactamase hydrolase domain-containing protein n=1 Tax=Tautonia marina TaxID=2653855 RepID=UPI0012607ED0|nr:sulfur transferase domain-containing protein [Tautonia marina]